MRRARKYPMYQAALRGKVFGKNECARALAKKDSSVSKMKQVIEQRGSAKNPVYVLNWG